MRQNKGEDQVEQRIDERFDTQDRRMDRMEANFEEIKKTLNTLTNYLMGPNHHTLLPIESAPRQIPWTRMPPAASQRSLGTPTSGKRSLNNTEFHRNLSALFSAFRAEVNAKIDQLEASVARAAEDLEIPVEDVDDGEEPVAGPSHQLDADAQSLGALTEHLAASLSSHVPEA
ncbi:hypothetical protein BD413DRAFT_674641 [Trametes elegans]|nr:hypothetical protein BD413DRAFT_674641 [Trametes elegans]